MLNDKWTELEQREPLVVATFKLVVLWAMHLRGKGKGKGEAPVVGVGGKVGG